MILYQMLEEHIQESEATVSDISKLIKKITQHIVELNQRFEKVEKDAIDKNAKIIALITEKEKESKLRYDELKKMAQSLKSN